MNERIKELVFRAGFIGESMNPIFGTCQETALKNFAELIVRECAMIADFAHLGGVIEPGVMVKEYFGVEE